MEEAPLLIRRYGDPCLKRPTDRVTEVAMEVIRTGERLARAMRTVGGVGISAPQIGSTLRMSLVSGLKGTAPDPAQPSVLLINPELVWHSEDKLLTPEGCLSIDAARWFTSVWRWRRVTVRYQDASLNEQTWTAEGYVARILQHELDHLDGKMISDGLKRQQRRAIERLVATPAPKLRRPVYSTKRMKAIEQQATKPPKPVADRDLPIIIHK